MQYFVYLLQCADGSLYAGFTTDLKRREAVHNAGRGAKYTRSRLPVRLVYFESYETEHGARSREWHIKRLSHAEKLALVAERGVFGAEEIASDAEENAFGAEGVKLASGRGETKGPL